MKFCPEIRLSTIIHLAMFCALVFTGNANASDDESLWKALREGTAFAIMRHATAPGVGDPSNFDVNDCSTQRNLSNEGRHKASKIGARIHKNGIKSASVFSSAWCRCRETAELLDIGEVSTLKALNSFFRNSAQRQPQTEVLKNWLANYKFNSPLFLVTHNVNIRALTGAHTNQGDVVVVRIKPTGELVVLGKL